MNNEIKFDHFKDINDLLKNIDSWYREDDIEYTRWFGLEDLHILGIYITSLQQKVEQLEKENKILKENAEHNDKVVDKVNWENMLLKGKLKDLKDRIMLKQLRLVNEETYNVLHSDLKELLEVLDREIKYEQ